MKLFSSRLAAVSLLLGLAGSALASDYEAIEERLAGLVPDMSQVVIAETPMNGIMQVLIGSDVVYMSDDGRFLMQGRMIDMDTQIDLTDQAKSGVRKSQLADVWTAPSSFHLVTRMRPTIFLCSPIPDCGYCRRLHEHMDEYVDAGIRIHYLAFPTGRVSARNPTTSWFRYGVPRTAMQRMDVAKAGTHTPPPLLATTRSKSSTAWVSRWE